MGHKGKRLVSGRLSNNQSVLILSVYVWATTLCSALSWSVGDYLASTPPVHKCQEVSIDAADEEEVESPEEIPVPAVDSNKEQYLAAVDEQTTAQPAHC